MLDRQGDVRRKELKDIMGWNGSGQKGATPVQPKVTAKKPSPIRGLIAGGAVVALAVVAYFVFFSGGEKPEGEKAAKERGRIKEVTPAAAPTNKVVKARKPKFPGAPLDWDKPYPPQAYWPDGRLKQHSRYVKVITNRVEDMYRSIEEKTFKNPAEVHVALMLNHEPGGMLIGDLTYGKDFVKWFKRSLETPIVIEKDDTPEVVELKKAVIDAKKMLKERMDAGEDVAQIMNDCRKEQKELGLYRQELEKQIREIRKNSNGPMSVKDYQDLISAANTMLENRGCAPIKIPELTIRRMEYAEARRLARQNGTPEPARPAELAPQNQSNESSK